MACAIQLTRVTNGEIFSIGVHHIAYAVENSQAQCTLVMRGNMPSVTVTESSSVITGKAGGKLIDVTWNGAAMSLNKMVIRQVHKNDETNNASVSLDTGQTLDLSNTYSSIEDALGECGGDPGPIHGNILYVSKNGDDATAEKGNPHKPWSHPITAKNAASSGDLIEVFPGLYTLDASGSSADYVGADIQLNLDFGAISYFFHPAVVLYYEGGGNRAVFRGRSGSAVQTYVYGSPDLYLDGDIRFIDNRDAESQIYAEFGDIRIGASLANNASAWGNTDRTIYFVLKARSLQKITGSCYIGFEGSTLSNSYQHIEIDSVTSSAESAIVEYCPSGVNLTNVIRIDRYKEFNINLLTNYFYDIRGGTWGDSYFEFTVDKMDISSSNNNVDEFFRNGGGTTILNDSKMIFNIKSGTFYSAFYRDISGSMSCNAGGKVIFRGDYYFTGVKSGSQVDGVFEISSPTIRAWFDDVYVDVVDGAAIRVENTVTLLEISGVFKRRENDAVVDFSAVSSAFMKDCYLENTGAAATINAAAAVTITTAGLYTSNTAQDVDITFSKLHEPS